MSFPHLTWGCLRQAAGVSAIGLAMVASPLRAQNDAHILYKLQPGDTLSRLVVRMGLPPQALQDIVRDNNLQDPNLIFAGDDLRIPRYPVRSVPSTATVSRINCSSIVRLDGGRTVPVQAGDKLQEGHVVQIPAGCQMAVTLEDHSQLRMLSGAVVKFRTLRRQSHEAVPQVSLELLDGRTEVSVPRKRLNGDAAFEIRTPISVAGVRGTEFRMGFDARQRKSQIEVTDGEVVTKGEGEAQEQTARAGQAVVTEADGKSLPIEDMLAAPRYAGGSSGAGRGDWVFHFEAPAKAREFLVRLAEDASFSFFQSSRSIPQPQLQVDGLGSRTSFQQWAAVSASGIVGFSNNYAFCRAYLRQDAWRCNVNFKMFGIENPHLRLLRMEPSGQQTAIVDRDLKLGAQDQLVLRGLPSGRYKWQIEHDLEEGRRTTQNGEFELVTIPADIS